MIFYNGFNLMLDLIFVSTAALWFHGVGYRKAKRKALENVRGASV